MLVLNSGLIVRVNQFLHQNHFSCWDSMTSILSLVDDLLSIKCERTIDAVIVSPHLWTGRISASVILRIALRLNHSIERWEHIAFHTYGVTCSSNITQPQLLFARLEVKVASSDSEDSAKLHCPTLLSLVSQKGRDIRSLLSQ
jgi:hypothetical protein